MLSEETTPYVKILCPDRVADARILAVAFDFDDTLVRLAVEWQQVMAGYFVSSIYGDTLPVGQRAQKVAELRAHIRAVSGTPLTVFMRELRESVVRAGLMTPRSVEHYRRGFDQLWRRTSARLHTVDSLVPGAPELVAALSASHVEVFVVTGGDVDHKVHVLESLGLCEHIPRSNILGDGDSRFPSGFSKAAALRLIRERVLGSQDVARYAGVPVVAMIGDGRRDMEAARHAGALAVGFNQPASADVLLRGSRYPVADIIELLVPDQPHAARHGGA